MFNIINWPDIVALLEDFDLSRYISILLISFKKCIYGSVERIKSAFIWIQENNCWWKRKQCKWKCFEKYPCHSKFTIYMGCIFWSTWRISQFSHSVVSNSATPWTAARQASLSITNSWSLLKLMSIGSVMPSSHLILCHPILLPPSIFPSIRLFSNESALHTRWPKYWSFSFSISPSNESGPISFRMDWLDLLAVQGTLKSLLQRLRCSAFFMVQLSHLHRTTGKTIALTGRTFVSKVMPLLFNMLSRLAIDFLPRSKHLLISWLQSPSAVILKPKKIKSVTVSTVSPSICLEVMGPDAIEEYLRFNF